MVGMVENGSDGLRLEVYSDYNVRSAEVLTPLIKQHVEPSTIICTDCWKAYDCLATHGYKHRHLNHTDSDNLFVAKDGTHTQRIESQWQVIKLLFTRDNYNNPENIADLIIKYIL